MTSSILGCLSMLSVDVFQGAFGVQSGMSMDGP